MSRPKVAVLLLGGLPQQNRPNIQDFRIYHDLLGLGLPVETFPIPERFAVDKEPQPLTPLELLNRGRFVAEVLKQFKPWYAQRRQKFPDHRFVLGGYSAGGMAIYAWTAQRCWREQSQILLAFTLAAPHQCLKGFFNLERIDGRVVPNLTLPFNESPIRIDITANRLKGRLQILYGEQDKMVEPPDAKFPLVLRDFVQQHAIPNAGHFTIGNDDTACNLVIGAIRQRLDN